MSSRLTPTVLTVGSSCHRCATPIAADDRAWRVTTEGHDGGWVCLACARPFVTGRPGSSAELEAMRRMRTEPIIQPAPVRHPPRTGSRPVAPGPATPAAQRPAAQRLAATTALGPRRWRRLMALSILTVCASVPLAAAGPVGRVLAASIGYPAAVLFWASVIGLPVAAVRAGWRSRRQPAPAPRAVRPPMPADGALASRRAAGTSGHVRITGAEDNWVKGVRGEQAVGAALDATGLAVIHDRRLRAGSAANIDHLVVAADAIYVVDAKNLAGSLSAIGERLEVGGRDRGKLLHGVRHQAVEVAAAMARLGVTVPVRPVLCLTGAARPAGIPQVSGVLLTTPETVAQVITLPGLLHSEARAPIADLLAWAFPPAVPTAVPAVPMVRHDDQAVGALPTA